MVPTMKIELSDYEFYQHLSPLATEMLCFDRSGSADRDFDPHSLPLLHMDSSSSDCALHSPSLDFPSDMDYAESPYPTAAGCGAGGCRAMTGASSFLSKDLIASVFLSFHVIFLTRATKHHLTPTWFIRSELPNTRVNMS
jgi:hypothetical protein